MEAVEKILKKRKVKPTAMRMLVLQFLLKNKVAVSLSDVENYFDKSDRTTLFRTLKTFVKHEIVHKIDDGTGVAKYALCEENCHCEVDADLHVHFRCKSCNETICLPNSKIPHIDLPAHFSTEEVNLVVTGVCDKCQR